MAQHLSFRVPWHDNGWNGLVCSNPLDNQSCLRLNRISEEKNTEYEMEHASQSIGECGLACVKEGAAFMSEKDIVVDLIHPYASWSEYHNHLLPTRQVYPAYSYPATPYLWLMKHRNGNREEDFMLKTSQDFGFDYDPIIEPKFKTEKIWVQNGVNQSNIFKFFFSDVKPDESLCVFYAKQVPFAEDTRRVVIGIGHVKKVETPRFYDSNNPKGMPSCLWETPVIHSIRKDMRDGFLLPYNQFVAYAEDHSDFDIEQAIVYGDSEYFDEFSFKTEHLSYDAVIDVILQCINVLTLAKECKLEGNWDKCLEWLNNELLKAWKDRGAFPGLGAMLCAIKVNTGIIVARILNDKCKETNEDIWQLLSRVMEAPKKYLPSSVAKGITETSKKIWSLFKEKDKKTKFQYFKLLSRINLTILQAEELYYGDFAKKHANEVLDNPYALFELTREYKKPLQLSVNNIDMAMFPKEYVEKLYPFPKQSKMESPYDQRRVRALIIDLLEKNSDEGNTILPVDLLCKQVSARNIDPKCILTEDVLDIMYDYLTSDYITIKEDSKGNDYYKLERYEDIDGLIETQLKARTNAAPLEIIGGWKEKIIAEKGECPPDDYREQDARLEKEKTLEMLSASPFSVLVGGAGTGKTFVINLLCEEPEIKKHGVLLLAPTGKARVRMQKGNFKAYTIAQYLFAHGYYDVDTQRYVTKQIKDKYPISAEIVPQTVIVDESSMITEDMMGALLMAIKSAKRIIFVGDSNQLPPIGAGRPFLDIIKYLEEKDAVTEFPYVGKNYAKLTVPRRQKGSDENKLDDVKLSKCFIDGASIDDEVFYKIQSGESTERIEFIQWENKEDLQDKIFEIVNKTINSDGQDQAFERSYGGFKPIDVKLVEDWQILSPLRNATNGSVSLNQSIHEKYRKKSVNDALKKKRDNSSFPQPFGPDRIITGDKVINVVNHQADRLVFENGRWTNKYRQYVANGELGIVVDTGKNYGKLNVEFSSQPGGYYNFKSSGAEDGEQSLELAYALTVHKAQGSQFGTVILVLMDNCRLMSREMLYTALTRQEEKIYVLYNKDLYELSKFTNTKYSEIARRHTDLLFSPHIVPVQNRYFEESLIHVTVTEELVRSKSEVVIYNELCNVKDKYGLIDFIYENKMTFEDGYTLLPDFWIMDGANNKDYIWEHLGLPGNKEYMERWKKKEAIYNRHGYSREKGNLIVTMDGLNGSINSKEIRNLAKKIGMGEGI